VKTGHIHRTQGQGQEVGRGSSIDIDTRGGHSGLWSLAADVYTGYHRISEGPAEKIDGPSRTFAKLQTHPHPTPTHLSTFF
jgi:hypothetical protein